jgi:hypothetical protein
MVKGAGIRLCFEVYFCYISNTFLIWKPNQLRDALILGFFSINTYDCHLNKCNPTIPQTYLGFCLFCLVRRQICFIQSSFDRRCGPAIGRACLRNHHPKWSCTGRGRIKFLGSILHDGSIASSHSSPRFVYLVVRGAPIVIINAQTPKVSVIFTTQ